MMLCNNFYEHFQMLRDWLKNIVRLFSAYLNKETHKKLLCHTWKFYLCVSSILLVTSEVMSILRNLERIKALRVNPTKLANTSFCDIGDKKVKVRRKTNSKETRCDTDLTKSLDSVALSQRTHQVTVPSHLETNFCLLDNKTAR